MSPPPTILFYILQDINVLFHLPRLFWEIICCHFGFHFQQQASFKNSVLKEKNREVRVVPEAEQNRQATASHHSPGFKKDRNSTKSTHSHFVTVLLFPCLLRQAQRHGSQNIPMDYLLPHHSQRSLKLAGTQIKFQQQTRC